MGTRTSLPDFVAERLGRRPGCGMSETRIGRVDELQLRLAQGTRRRRSGAKLLVESKEERRRNVVVDLPQCADHASRAGSEERARQTRHPGDVLRVPAERSARREDDQRMTIEAQSCDVVRADDT